MAFEVEKIEKSVDRVVAAAIPITEEAGGIAITTFGELIEFAKIISMGGIAVRKHFRNNPGAVIAVTMQAREWRMSPISVMNKSYEVNDQLAYEAQLIHAVVEARAPLTQRLEFGFKGEGVDRQCIVTGHLKGEPKPKVYESPPVSQIHPKNSPLWKSDTDQQLSYYSSRAWSRRYVPDVLLGIYSKDEVEDSEPLNVTPATPTVGDRLRERKDKKASGEGFNTPKITQQMSEVVPDKIIERETVVVESRAASGSNRENSEHGHVISEPSRETVPDDEAMRVMQEAQGSPVAGATPEAVAVPAAAATESPAKAKRATKPKPEPAKPVAETAFERGMRLLPGQTTKSQVEELQESIAQELGSAESEQWIESCEARIDALKGP